MAAGVVVVAAGVVDVVVEVLEGVVVEEWDGVVVVLCEVVADEAEERVLVDPTDDAWTRAVGVEECALPPRDPAVCADVGVRVPGAAPADCMGTGAAGFERAAAPTGVPDDPAMGGAAGEWDDVITKPSRSTAATAQPARMSQVRSRKSRRNWLVESCRRASRVLRPWPVGRRRAMVALKRSPNDPVRRRRRAGRRYGRVDIGERARKAMNLRVISLRACSIRL